MGFHSGNGDDGKHYWLTPPDLMQALEEEFGFDFDPCPYPKPDDFDGLTAEWGQSNYVNPPFGTIIHEGKKKGPTAWVRKAIAEHQKGKRVVRGGDDAVLRGGVPGVLRLGGRRGRAAVPGAPRPLRASPRWSGCW